MLCVPLQAKVPAWIQQVKTELKYCFTGRVGVLSPYAKISMHVNFLEDSLKIVCQLKEVRDILRI